MSRSWRTPRSPRSAAAPPCSIAAGRGRKGNHEWKLRNRLTRSAVKMHADHLDPMAADLKALPKQIGEPILATSEREGRLDGPAGAARDQPQAADQRAADPVL